MGLRTGSTAVGGDDRLRGGMANDVLFGGMGDDTLDGRDAASLSDDLFCGGGSDGAMADTDDRVRADCENVDQNRAPSDLSLSPASVAENQPAATTVGTLTVTDPNAGDTHSYSLVAGTGSGDNGSFTLAGNALRTNAVFDYEAKSSYSVRIRVTDADGAGYEEQFAISVTDAVENTNPVAVDDTEGGTEDTQLDLPVSGAGSPAENDTDADSDPLTVTAVANATGGAASISGGTIQFVPAPNFCGAGGFDYTVSDGRGGTDVGHVTVDLTCVDDPPTAVDDSATLAEGDGATAIDVLANDTDVDGGPMAVDTVTQPANGTVVDHRRRHGPHVRARPELLQRPAGHRAGHVHVHARAGRLAGHGLGDRRLLRRSPDRGGRHRHRRRGLRRDGDRRARERHRRRRRPDDDRHRSPSRRTARS